MRAVVAGLAFVIFALHLGAVEARAAHVYERRVTFSDAPASNYTRVETVVASDLWMIEIRQAKRRWLVVRRGSVVLSSMEEDGKGWTPALRGSPEDGLEPEIRGFELLGEELVFTWPFPSFGSTLPLGATRCAKGYELEVHASVRFEGEHDAASSLVWKVLYSLERFDDGRFQATRVRSELGKPDSRTMAVDESSQRVAGPEATSSIADGSAKLERLPVGAEEGVAWPDGIPRDPAHLPTETATGLVIIRIPDLDRKVRVFKVEGAPRKRRPWRWLR